MWCTLSLWFSQPLISLLQPWWLAVALGTAVFRNKVLRLWLLNRLLSTFSWWDPFSKPSARAVVLQRAPFPVDRHTDSLLFPSCTWSSGLGFFSEDLLMVPRAAFACTAAQEVDVWAVLPSLVALSTWCAEWVLWRKAGCSLLAIGTADLPLLPHSFSNVFCKTDYCNQWDIAQMKLNQY